MVFCKNTFQMMCAKVCVEYYALVVYKVCFSFSVNTQSLHISVLPLIRIHEPRILYSKLLTQFDSDFQTVRTYGSDSIWTP